MASVQIHVFEEFRSSVSAEWIGRVVDCALAGEVESADGGVSVVIADDESVAALNKTHRGVEGATDVLSFSNVHSGRYYGEDRDDGTASGFPDFVLPPDCEPEIGEIVVSHPQAVRQAREAGHTSEMELAILLAHGVFHLLGYDHEDEREAAEMRGKERAATDSMRLAGLVSEGS